MPQRLNPLRKAQGGRLYPGQTLYTEDPDSLTVSVPELEPGWHDFIEAAVEMMVGDVPRGTPDGARKVQTGGG